MSDRDERLERLFHAALERPAAERAAFLEQACDGDRPLRDELVSLLGAHAAAPALLEQPAWALGADLPRAERVRVAALAETWGADPSGEPAAAGRQVRIGRYVLRRLLGEGGMGSVYLAEQQEPLRRTVALKLIKLGMDTAEVVARFDSERAALARLNHPHVAAVYDAGVSARGRPYFVMEYVDGERITAFCDRRRLPVRERVALVAAVCDAVQHAHGKGIVHRDLKPANILVKEDDGGPRPKIIDFGVAKAIASDGSMAEVTRRGQLVGTPGYMSPEQAGALGGDVDARSDVYSLGVLLYELLTGTLPHESRTLRRATDDELRRMLLEHDPVRPSLRVHHDSARARKAASQRDTDPRGLRRALRGDLDWIVLRALEKDPSRRYASAAELARDLRDHLAHEPVSAGPPGLLYRARKLAARYRGPVVGSATALLAALATLLAWAGHEASVNRDLGARVSVVEQVTGLRPAAPGGSDEPGTVGSASPVPAVRARNAGGVPLPPGTVVELSGRGDGEPAVLEVVPATSGSQRALLGSVLSADDGSSEPVPPGGLLRLATHGTCVPVLVDRQAGPVAAHDRLGVAGMPGRATRHGGGRVLGVALHDLRESEDTVLAWLAPGWAAEPPVPADEPAVALSGPGSRFVGERADAALAVPAASPDHGDLAAVAPARGAHESLPLLLSLAGGPAPAPPDASPLHGSGHAAPAGSDPPSQPTQQTQATPPAQPDTLPGLAAILPGLEVKKDTGEIDVGEALATGVVQQAGRRGGTVTSGDAPPPGPSGTLGIAGVDPSASPRADGAGSEGLAQEWGDADGDGLLDVLLVDDGSLRLLWQTAPGVFEDVTPWSGLHELPPPAQLVWGDLDGDALFDLLSRDTEGVLRLHRGLGGGSHVEMTGPAGLAGLGSPHDVVAFDADGDGATDLRVLAADGALDLLLNDGRGRFTAVRLRQGSDDHASTAGGTAGTGHEAGAASTDPTSKPGKGSP